jgi:hypothetical protein
MRSIHQAVRETAAHQDGIVRLDQLGSRGIGRDALQDDVTAGRAIRLHRGVFLVESDGPATPHQAHLAAQLHLGPESLLILRSAVAVHGLQGIVGAYVPQLAMPPGLERRQRHDLDIHFWDIPDEERELVDGLPVTTLRRTLADVARLLPRMQAVSCVDSALNLGLLTEADLSDVAAMMHRKRHCVAGRGRLAEARLGAQSPLETRVRLRAADGGLPPDALQVPVRDSSGVLLGYGDIGYLLGDGTWLIVEADGRSIHELPEALLHDRRRQNAFLAAAGHRILRFTWDDTQLAAHIPTVLRPALERGGWSPRRS